MSTPQPTSGLFPMATTQHWTQNNDEQLENGSNNFGHRGNEDDDQFRGEDDHDQSDDGVSASQNAIGIRHPHINDVLCGRGGLTNNHPGNEWFRKLVRSNRPLYHACPKHTKLLVSKAIVQAVQAQDPPGRFLERNKKDTLWYPVGYKKAVDKTSQGLREKERGDEIYQAPLPPMLANRSPKIPANLQDLARVTMARAGLDPILQNESHPKRQLPSVATNPDTRPPSSKRPKTAPPTVRTELPKAASPPVTATPTAQQEWDDPLPLPTQPLQARQSSMFRFLSQTRLLNDNSSSIHGSGLGTGATATSFYLAPGVSGTFAPAGNNKTANTPAPLFFSMPPPPPPPAAAQSSIGMPVESTVLTRLTSHFSDLFAAFWPQPSSASISGFQQHRQQQHQQLKQHRDAIQSTETAETMVSFATSPAATSLAACDSILVDSDARDIAPLAFTFSKSASSLAPFGNDDDDDDVAEGPTAVIARGELANDSDNVVEADNIAEEDSDAMPPSDLERSASATLLKLAANPTTFIHTLTEIFQRKSQNPQAGTNAALDDHDDQDGDELPAATFQPPARRPLPMFQYGGPPAAAPPPSSLKSPLGVSIAKRSLLEDYEETPEERRLRNLGSV